MRITADRYHDISCGHRVCGQGGKCEHLHGHNYRVHFEIEMESDDQVDPVGRVMDFSVIKSLLCMWLEEFWDHKFLVWHQDPWAPSLAALDPEVVWVPFNPTAENMAYHLLHVVGPKQLKDSGCRLIRVRIEETSKCAASCEL